jgi:cobalt transporter subunit CbtA
MALFRRIIFAAGLGGLIAGLFMMAAHAIATIPLILEAETYENAAPAEEHDHDAAAADTAGTVEVAAHEHEEEEWMPQDGIERTAFTLLAEIVTGIGFALLLTSAYVLSGREIDWRSGFFWGAAGFVTFTLAPSLGLPPELPGMEAAPLSDRQIWWIATALLTGGGLALLFLSRNAIALVAAVVMLVLPHIIGAPQPPTHETAVPASLLREFVVGVIVTSFLFWLVLGSLTGFFYKRFSAA